LGRNESVRRVRFQIWRRRTDEGNEGIKAPGDSEELVGSGEKRKLEGTTYEQDTRLNYILTHARILKISKKNSGSYFVAALSINKVMNSGSVRYFGDVKSSFIFFFGSN
jgi:hypothetical protein